MKPCVWYLETGIDSSPWPSLVKCRSLAEYFNTPFKSQFFKVPIKGFQP